MSREYMNLVDNDSCHPSPTSPTFGKHASRILGSLAGSIGGAPAGRVSAAASLVTAIRQKLKAALVGVLRPLPFPRVWGA
jgi:hypothetical protein